MAFDTRSAADDHTMDSSEHQGQLMGPSPPPNPPADERNLAAPWFKGQHHVSGQARAEFRNPAGAIHGPIELQFTEQGVANGSMRVEDWESSEILPLGVNQLFHQDRPVHEPGKVVLSVSVDSQLNECRRLTVSNDAGEFVVVAPIGYSPSFTWELNQSQRTRVTFQLFNGVWTTSNTAPAKFWVLPLTNLVSRWRFTSDAFDEHPLRFWRPTPIPEGLTEEQRGTAQWSARNQNRLITFEYHGLPAYIEPLPDYADRERRLLAGQDQRLVTAVMVGELPAGISTAKQVEDLLPHDLLLLLSLGTGSEVGASWIELRDADGGLVQRNHAYRGRPIFVRGHRAIDEFLHTGIGQLVNRGTAAASYGSSDLRVTIRHLVRAGYRSGLTMEDRLGYLFRALDGLCKSQEIHATVAAKHLLCEQDARAVHRVTKGASRDLRRLAGEVRQAGRNEAAVIIDRVAERIPMALEIERGYGRNVVDLVHRFSLSDVEVVERYLANNPRPDGRPWHAVLSYYRGLIMHGGYVDFDADQSMRKDVPTILDHLHDLLLRMVLRMVDYDGTYQPAVGEWTTESPVDWVVADTPPSRLGYK